MITDSAELATVFNNYFKEKVELLHKKINQNAALALQMTDDYLKKTFSEEDKANHLGPTEFGFQTVEDKVIYGIISNLKSSGAEGVDKLNTRILKRFKLTLTPYLRYITNLSILQSKYPTRWKVGVISPLPKSGNKHMKKNWRPVVLLCAGSKILEKVLQLQITGHLEARRIFPRTQHAYRRGKSCETALIDLNTQVEEARNKGLYAAACITDMSAAFNLIKKEVLVPKMSKFGFDEQSCKLLSDYLTGRKTKCRIKTSFSGLVELESGVGEGSVLGPTFFACGLIDIDQVGVKTREECKKLGFEVDVRGVEFADDCSGILICKTEDEMQKAVNVMIEMYQIYFESNGLCLNRSKSQVLAYRPKAKENDIYILDKCEENNAKLLGVFQDTEGEYEAHFQYVKRQCHERMKHLKSSLSYLKIWQRKKACESLILSKINYGLCIYGQSKVIQDKITVLVNDVIRMILGVKNPVDMHVDDLYSAMEFLSRDSKSGTLWMKGQMMYEYSLVMTMRRILRKACAPVTHEQIMSVPSRPGLRKGGENSKVGEMKQPWKKLHLRFSKRSFMVNSIRIINKRKVLWMLAEEEKSKGKDKTKGMSVEVFKKNLKKKIIEQINNGG